MICGNVAGPVCVAGVKPGTALEATTATSDFLARTIFLVWYEKRTFAAGARVYHAEKIKVNEVLGQQRTCPSSTCFLVQKDHSSMGRISYEPWRTRWGLKNRREGAGQAPCRLISRVLWMQGRELRMSTPGSGTAAPGSPSTRAPGLRRFCAIWGGG